MIPILFENEDILVVNKPSGIATHAPNATKQGIAEHIQEERGIKLGIHQRLDEGTSGVLAFSKSKRGAELLSKAFELRDVRKYYYAIVCGRPESPRGEWQHRLSHKNGITQEDPNGKIAKCRYRVVAEFAPYTLLELELLTGITHQLRVQCALCGMPIHGDSLYGGGDQASRLYLHAHKLVLLNEKNLPHFVAPLPTVMQKPNVEQVFTLLCKNLLATQGPFAKDEAVRLFVPQHSGMPEVIVEKLASTLFIRHIEPLTASLWTPQALSTLMRVASRIFGCTQTAYTIHESPNKSRACRVFAKAFKTEIAPFWATEHGIQYQFDLLGNAVGLYLDQRQNRAWIMENAHGNALNLFAYTCAFSLCAAKSLATTGTISIDSSKAALNRGRENFEHNAIPMDGHRFIVEDVQKYLERCLKNGTKFDTVICDPPSFGRAGKTVFSLDEALETLVRLCVQVAAPGATILFCINHRKIRLARLRQAFETAARQARITFASFDAFVNDDACGPLGVGTDLKTVRCQLKDLTNENRD